jgi:NAD(P)H-hydrate epimerase
MKKRNNRAGKMLFTSAQARAKDAALRERFGISTLTLMENAGRAVAAQALRMIRGAGKVAVVCGKGNNGGDGFVCARHLAASGVQAEVYTAGDIADVREEAGVNLDILRRLGWSVTGITEKNISVFKRRIIRYNLIVDALLGVGLQGDVRGVYRDIIGCVNASGIAVIAVDIPSGLDADTGEILGACVKARQTVTFIAGKRGMFTGQGPQMCGEIIVENLGVPRSALKSKVVKHEKSSG